MVIRDAPVIVADWGAPPVLNGWIAISGGKVAAIGKGPPPDAATYVDGHGCMVIPGFVAAHHHLYQGASRGMNAAGGLLGWLTVHYRAWARMTEEDVRAAATASLAQLALGGCTTVAAFEYLHPADADFVSPVVEAANQVGLRLMYVRGCSPRLEGPLAKELASSGVDVSRLVEPEDLALARTVDTLRSPGSDMLRWGCGPTTPVIDDGGDFHRRLTRIADTYGVGLHTHFHPLPGSARGDESAAQLANRLGLVREGNWFAHGSALTGADVASFGQDGVGIVHNPSCSVLLGYPIPDLAAWREGNARVALSVDGSASNDRGSMLGEAQLAWQLQRVARGAGRESISAATVMELGTTGAASALGWPGLGRLSVGSPADLAIIDVRELDYAGAPESALGDPAALICRTYSGGRVRRLVVGGRTVVDEGRLTGVDEATVAGDVADAARRLYPANI